MRTRGPSPISLVSPEPDGTGNGFVSQKGGADSRRPLLERTLEVWQPRTQRLLSLEDAREIAENMTSFFDILREWEAKERREAEHD